MRFMEFYVRPIAAVIVVFVTTIALFGILSVTPGYAHDPIFIENTQLSPAEGPYPVSYTHLTLPTNREV